MSEGDAIPPELRAGAFLADSRSSATTDTAILGFWTASHARHIEPHRHSDPHFMLVTSGIYKTRARGGYSRNEGLLIFNPAHTEHDDHLESGGAFFTITIRDDQLLDDKGRAEAAPETLHSPAAFGRARRLLRELCNWCADSDVITDCLVGELAAIVQGATVLKTSPAWLRRARELLEDNFKESISVAGMAAALGVHPLYLIRSFRTHFGTTPGEYLRARRLREAASLLTHSIVPIAELALEAGFADQAHLTHRFTTAYGISPGAYRRSTRG